MKILAKQTLPIFGLALAFSPILHAEKEAKPEAKTPDLSTETQLDAGFAAISDTINAVRAQASEALKQRNQALSELEKTRNSQLRTSKELADSLKAQTETEEQLATLRKQLEATQQAEKKFRKEAEALAQQLKLGDEARQKLIALRTRMEDSLKAFDTIQGNLASVSKEFDRPTAVNGLKQEIAELKAASSDLEKKLNASASKLKEQAKTNAIALEAAGKKEHELAKQLAETRKSSKETTEKVAMLEKTKVDALRSLMKAREELRKAREIVASTEKGSAIAKKEKDASAAELEKVTKRAVEMEGKAKNASAKLDSVKKETAEMKQTLQQRNELIQKLEARMKEVSENSPEEEAKGDS